MYKMAKLIIRLLLLNNIVVMMVTPSLLLTSSIAVSSDTNIQSQAEGQDRHTIGELNKLKEWNKEEIQQYLYYFHQKREIERMLKKGSIALDNQKAVIDLHNEIIKRVNNDLQKIDEKYGKNHQEGRYDPDEIRHFLGQKKEDSINLGGLMLRGPDELSQIGKYPSSNLQDATSSKISFSRNLTTRDNDWVIRGSVIYPLDRTDWFSSVSENNVKADSELGVTKPELEKFYLAPGIKFDRESLDSNHSKDVNQLTFFVGGITKFLGGEIIPVNYFRLYATQTTDFDFKSSIPALRFQWEPTFKLPGSWVTYSIVPEFKIRWGALLDSWAGATLETRESAELENRQAFFRLGPSLSLEIWPWAHSLDSRLKLKGSWTYLRGVEGDPDEADLLDTTCSWVIIPNSHISLDLSYQQGRLLESLERVNSITLGVGAKF